jgi:hypothetical protein
MRKTKLVFGTAGAFILSVCAFCAVPAQTNFSGTWVLDKDETGKLPPGLKSYTMVVTHNQQQLVVESKLEGDFWPPEGAPSEGPPGGGGFPSGSEGGGFPGGPGGGGPPGGGPPSGLMALRMVIPSATYSLDDKETTAEVEEPMPGTATLKATWAKGGKGLELSVVRDFDFQGNSVTFTSKETWKLSEDGEVLKVQRSVQTPRGTDTVKLTFRKERGESQTPQQ